MSTEYSKGEMGREGTKLAAILEAAVDAIITIDAAGIVEAVNPAAEKLFHYTREEMVGRNVSFLMPEPYRSRHDDYMHRHNTTGERRIIGIGREVAGLRSDGTTFPMHLSVNGFDVDGERFFVGIVHDLSRRKEAEAVLRQAYKMEAVGQLTGGIAHDFNNLLTVVIGNLELLEMQLKDADQRDLLREAQDASDMGARLTERLLAFARRSHLEPEVVNLNSLVLGLTDLLHRTLGGPIDLSTSLATNLWLTRADPSQIENGIVNLAVNARDAMPDGGKLILETGNAVIDEQYIAEETGLLPGDYVRLSITDTGQGMPADVCEHAFEPFFTTKDAGRGTGLGLSMIYGFARQSGGMATLYTEVGVGTTVNVYLPRIDSDVRPVGGLKADVPAVSGNGEVVLVVEDDDRVRSLTLARVRQLGYAVLEAADGHDALELLATGEPVDLLFTDLVMPGGLSGYQLCERVRQLYPDIRMLLTSGYSEDLVHAEKIDALRLDVLRKPYRQGDLASALRAALEPS